MLAVTFTSMGSSFVQMKHTITYYSNYDYYFFVLNRFEIT